MQLRAIGMQLHLIATAKAFFFDTASGCSTQFQKLPFYAYPTDLAHPSHPRRLVSLLRLQHPLFSAASD
jgi:hypothetical protein